jgi:hypothetical protein
MGIVLKSKLSLLPKTVAFRQALSFQEEFATDEIPIRC